MSGAIAALVLMAAGNATPAGAALPSEISGVWDVEQVAVDAQDQMHWEVKPDDPTLMGRTLIVEAGRAQFDDGKQIGCKAPSVRRWPTTWGFLIGKGFPRPPGGGRGRSPSPGDFGLKVGRAQKVTAFSLCPGSKGKTAERFPNDAWVALDDSNRLALHYDNQVLLLMRRRPADARPAPSFDCQKAGSATEKAICESFDLASWDRSVALAYRRALEGKTPERQTELKHEQHEWLEQRDACGAKSDCIDEQLWRRVEDLNQD